MTLPLFERVKRNILSLNMWVSMKKNSKKNNQLIKNNKFNTIKKIAIICVVIVVIELIAMLALKLFRERNIDHIDAINDLIEISDGYIAVGISDFYNSKSVNAKIYEYINSTTKEKSNIIANQSKIAKYDKNMNLIWENTFENKYDSTFYSVLKVDDGYIAVGSIISRYEQIEINTRDGLIVKFGLDGQVKWHKTYHVLSDTEFYKIIDDGDNNFVVIGQSIYENMEVGSHITGGGIIVRYDKDGNMLAHNNYGGNKSGSFNDILKVKDGYIVCGKDATNYGILIKFKKDFNRDDKDTNLITKKIIWQRTYSNTDTVGFSAMALNKDIIYVVGAINTSNEKDDKGNTKFKYDAGIVLYNTSGKYLGKYSIEDNTYHRFNSLILEDDNLILTGLLDYDSINKTDKQESMVYKFNIKDNKFMDKKVFNSNNDYIISKIIKLDKNIIIGSSKTKCSIYGCEYEPIISIYK